MGIMTNNETCTRQSETRLHTMCAALTFLWEKAQQN